MYNRTRKNHFNNNKLVADILIPYDVLKQNFGFEENKKYFFNGFNFSYPYTISTNRKEPLE